MMGASLSSDHVNYLIWRYLQERGYGRSAVQLMRDWGVEPQTLPFAPAVKPHMLVSILQDGLIYDELQSGAPPRDTTPQRADRQQSEATDSSRRYTFLDRRKRQASESAEDGREEVNRKRPRLQTNGSQDTPPEVGPTRQGRRTSSLANINTRVNGNALSVDPVDSAIADIKPVSPDEDYDMQVDEPAPITTTLIVGTSVGVQSITQAPTTFTVADILVPGSELIHTSWDPSDPTTVLATGGCIWRSWNIPPSLGADEGLPEPDFVDHNCAPGGIFVSATSRAPTGDFVAVAFESDGTSSIIVQVSKVHSDSIPAPSVDDEDPDEQASHHISIDGAILALRWTPSSSHLLAIQARDESIKASIYEMPSGNLLVEEDIDNGPALDAAWISDDQFILCGEQMLSLHAISPHISLVHNLETPEAWTAMKWDSISGLTACFALADGVIALLSTSNSTSIPTPAEPNNAPTPTLTIQSTAVQSGQITALEWQPLDPTLPFLPLTQRLLATASTHGTINVWSALSGLQCLHTLIMGAAAPAMAMAFSPDGAYIAATGDGRLDVWRTDVESKAVAVWEAEQDRERETDTVNGVNGDGGGTGHQMELAGEEMPFHTLAWDTSGSRLAFGSGDRLRVIGLALQG